MVRRERVLNKLTDLGFIWVNSVGNVDGFRLKMRYAAVPRRDLLEDEFVRRTLQAAGCDTDQIDEFLGTNQAIC